jgi:actin-like ATPase involved in cell morphogenesis
VARSIRVAGDEMNEDIINYAKQKYNLLIGEQMAERVKIEAGSAYPLEPELVVELRGRNLISGCPRHRGQQRGTARGAAQLGQHHRRHDASRRSTKRRRS